MKSCFFDTLCGNQ
ncbi:hypothetical protein KSF78_0002322 [Schistosoma japonicum]|nr:hypothetical protein KSF78_0002322 [Schistosoma japonicum]